MKLLLDTCVWGGARKDSEDFGEIAIVHGTPHSGIIRLVDLAARKQGVVCLRVIDMYGNELQSGAIVTAEPGRLRIRPAE